MNWYGKLKLLDQKNISQEDVNDIINKKILNPEEMKLLQQALPSNLKLKKEKNEGWSLVKEDERGEQTISYNEPTPGYALRGGEIRYPLMT